MTNGIFLLRTHGETALLIWAASQLPIQIRDSTPLGWPHSKPLILWKSTDILKVIWIFLLSTLFWHSFNMTWLEKWQFYVSWITCLIQNVSPSVKEGEKNAHCGSQALINPVWAQTFPRLQRKPRHLCANKGPISEDENQSDLWGGCTKILFGFGVSGIWDPCKKRLAL